MDQAVTIAPANESERLARSVDAVSLQDQPSPAEPTVWPLNSLSICTRVVELLYSYECLEVFKYKKIIDVKILDS